MKGCGILGSPAVPLSKMSYGHKHRGYACNRQNIGPIFTTLFPNRQDPPHTNCGDQFRRIAFRDFTHFQILLSYQIALYAFERNVMEFHCSDCSQRRFRSDV
jgi:hypothetical protein